MLVEQTHEIRHEWRNNERGMRCVLCCCPKRQMSGSRTTAGRHLVPLNCAAALELTHFDASFLSF